MATIPFNQQFHSVSHDVDTIERGSAQANSRRQVYSMQDIMDTSDALAHKFPIKSGETMTSGDLVMLDNSGDIFNIASSGTVPFTLPIGQDVDYWAQEFTGPRGYMDKQGLIQWVSDNGDFIEIAPASNYPPRIFGRGGNVNAAGTVTFERPYTEQLTYEALVKANLVVDQTTFGQSTVRGIIGGKSHNNSDWKAYSFEYDVATQVFTMSIPYITLPGNWGGYASANDAVYVGANKYLLASENSNQAVILTVSNNTPTLHTIVSTPQATNSVLTHISDGIVVWNYSDNSGLAATQIMNVDSSNVITLGSVVTSTFSVGYTMRTTKLNANSKYYLIIPEPSNNAPQHVEVFYDTPNNTVIYDTTAYTPDVSQMMSYSPYGVSYYGVKDAVITTGTDGSQSNFMIQYNVATHSFITIPIIPGTEVPGYIGNDVRPDGRIILQYSDQAPYPNVGMNMYGQLGDTVSNLNGDSLIGVNNNSSGTVKLPNSVITNASLSLTVNSPVYVAYDGVVSSTSGATSAEIGYAISATSYVLKIR